MQGGRGSTFRDNSHQDPGRLQKNEHMGPRLASMLALEPGALGMFRLNQKMPMMEMPMTEMIGITRVTHGSHLGYTGVTLV